MERPVDDSATLLAHNQKLHPSESKQTARGMTWMNEKKSNDRIIKKFMHIAWRGRKPYWISICMTSGEFYASQHNSWTHLIPDEKFHNAFCTEIESKMQTNDKEKKGSEYQIEYL